MKFIVSLTLSLGLALSLVSCDFFKQLTSKDSGQVASKSDSSPSDINLSGVYTTSGTNPGGNQGGYSGYTTITKEGDQYKVHWKVGTVYDGIGKLEGKVFKVEWGSGGNPVGLVTYTLQEGGVLQGTWYTYKNPNALGTETLTPQK